MLARVRLKPPMVAALFVQTGGCYFGVDRVDPWDEERDARRYSGPYPVVAHPPCSRWGRYWGGWGGTYTPGEGARFQKADDGGCFATALHAVRIFGGVLEHPKDSAAWDWFGLNRPHSDGGWISADRHGGFTCCVDQGMYGHRAKKATWLYACKVATPELLWGRAEGKIECQKLWRRQREATPTEFRDLLIAMARNART